MRSGLIDDSQFTEAWVRARSTGRAMGPRRIAWELRQKGVDAEVVRDAVTSFDEEAHRNALRELEKTLGAKIL